MGKELREMTQGELRALFPIFPVTPDDQRSRNYSGIEIILQKASTIVDQWKIVRDSLPGAGDTLRQRFAAAGKQPDLVAASPCPDYAYQAGNRKIFYESHMLLRIYRTNEVVQLRVYFVADAIAEIEGYLEGNRDFCKPQMLRKAPQMLPPNCAVYP